VVFLCETLGPLWLGLLQVQRLASYQNPCTKINARDPIPGVKPELKIALKPLLLRCAFPAASGSGLWERSRRSAPGLDHP
jgi:hypothetical protein